MKNDNNSTKISYADIGKTLGGGVINADRQRQEQLAVALRMREVKSSQLQREHERLANKYGPDNGYVRSIVTQHAANQTMVSTLAKEGRKAAVVVPAANKDAWTVFGVVYDSQGRATANRIVSAHDEKGNRVTDAQAMTDSAGYYELVLEKGAAATPQMVDKPTMTEAVGKKAAADRKNTAFPVFLHVTDGGGQILHRDHNPLYPQRGQVTYCELALPVDICADIKKGGKPSKKDK